MNETLKSVLIISYTAIRNTDPWDRRFPAKLERNIIIERNSVIFKIRPSWHTSERGVSFMTAMTQGARPCVPSTGNSSTDDVDIDPFTLNSVPLEPLCTGYTDIVVLSINCPVEKLWLSAWRMAASLYGYWLRAVWLTMRTMAIPMEIRWTYICTKSMEPIKAKPMRWLRHRPPSANETSCRVSISVHSGREKMDAIFRPNFRMYFLVFESIVAWFTAPLHVKCTLDFF